MKAFLTKKVSLWLLLVMAICLLAGGILSTLSARALPSPPVVATKSETRNTEVINSLSLKHQVVLLSLGIQGIAQKTGSTTFLGVDIPGSERESLIKYAFNAKLGIEGQEVVVTRTGDNYLLTIPKFIFIGHDKESFELVHEDNGVLSWVTPENDKVGMINNILGSGAKAEYIHSNDEILKDQAKAFYAGIINSIDPAVSVTFAFVN